MGGTSGIGHATAQTAVALGARVVVAGRDERKLREWTNERGNGATGERVDASDPGELASFFARLGPFDHLVLSFSAGPAGAGPTATLNLDELRAGFAGKFWPYIMVLQAALSHGHSRGSITMVGAASAGAPLPGVAGFAAISGALEAMIPALAVELKPLRVNAVSPGVVNTPFWTGLPEQERSTMFAKYASATLVGRIATPDDVGRAIIALMTNTYITGVVLRVDGGLTLAGNN
jgi:NAD(P)-dependent dehydrogenase (short-subunit alcohol dehydrogenase family)